MQIYQDEKEINDLIVKINYYNNIGINSTKENEKLKKKIEDNEKSFKNFRKKRKNFK